MGKDFKDMGEEGQKISSNQKISLTKVVGYVSGVTKTSQAPARLGPKQLCVST